MSKEQGMGSKIRAVVFDFGGVLMRTVNPVPRHDLEQRFGLSPGGASKLVFGSPLWDETQLGRIHSAEFWADFGQRLGLNAGELAEFQQAFWAGDRLDEELVALIRYLRDAGYRTALLSNAPTGLRQHLEQLGIADAFDVIVTSGCEGLMKPDATIFELTLARMGVAAEEAIFVDDSRVNLAAARQVGLHATRFRGLSPLRKWLQNLGLPVPDPVLIPLPDVRAVIFDWGGVIEALPDEAHITEWERRLALDPGTLPGYGGRCGTNWRSARSPMTTSGGTSLTGWASLTQRRPSVSWKRSTLAIGSTGRWPPPRVPCGAATRSLC